MPINSARRQRWSVPAASGPRGPIANAALSSNANVRLTAIGAAIKPGVNPVNVCPSSTASNSDHSATGAASVAPARRMLPMRNACGAENASENSTPDQSAMASA